MVALSPVRLQGRSPGLDRVLSFWFIIQTWCDRTLDTASWTLGRKPWEWELCNCYLLCFADEGAVGGNDKTGSGSHGWSTEIPEVVVWSVGLVKELWPWVRKCWWCYQAKLLEKWQGPFEIKRKLGPTNYEIATPGLDRPSKVLHINLLKEWIPHPDDSTGGRGRGTGGTIFVLARFCMCWFGSFDLIDWTWDCVEKWSCC